MHSTVVKHRVLRPSCAIEITRRTSTETGIESFSPRTRERRAHEGTGSGSWEGPAIRSQFQTCAHRLRKASCKTCRFFIRSPARRKLRFSAKLKFAVEKPHRIAYRYLKFHHNLQHCSYRCHYPNPYQRTKIPILFS